MGISLPAVRFAAILFYYYVRGGQQVTLPASFFEDNRATLLTFKNTIL
jgi:hypothetical protein